MTSSPPSTPVRPLFRWAAIVTLVLSVPIGLHAVWDYVESKRVMAAIAAVGRNGGSLNRPQLERSSPPPNAADDAAPFYMAAASLASTNLPFGSVTLADGRFFSGVPGPTEALAWFRDGTVPADMLAQTRIVLDQQAETFRLLDLATARPFNGFARGTTYGAQITQFDQLARLGSMRTVHAAVTHDRALAVQSLRSELRLFGDPARRIMRSPVSKLPVSTLGLRVLLNTNALTAADLEALAQDFERPDDDHILEGLLDELRAGYIAAFLDRARYSSRSIGLSGPVGLPGDTSMVPRPLLAQHFRRRLDAYAAVIAASRLPWSERLDQVRAVARTWNWRDDGGFLVDHGWSQDPWGLTAAPMIVLSARVARATLAVERYRQAHPGQLPATLDATVPDFLPAVPLDPYSGRALRYVRMEQGYQIYGVSYDREDNGGDQLKDPPVMRINK